MRARLNGIDINFAVSGPETAPAVVLHHPIGGALSFWDILAAELDKRYRVVRLDARGHGETSAPAGAYTFDMLTADVIALMDHLGLDKVRFVGLSMGGMIGQYLGINHADRLHALCLAATTCQTPPEARPLWEDRIRTVGAEGYTQQMVDVALQRWLAPTTFASRPDLVAKFRTYLTSTPPQGYVGWCHAIRDLALADKLKAITTPTLVIAGKEDPAAPPAAAELIASRIPGAELAIVPGAAHMINVEAPDAFHKLVIPFLDRHGPAAR